MKIPGHFSAHINKSEPRFDADSHTVNKIATARPTTDGQIGQRPDIAAVSGPRQCSICGTVGLKRSQTTANEDAIRADVLMLNNNTGGTRPGPSIDLRIKVGPPKYSPPLPGSEAASSSNLHGNRVRANIARR